MARLFNYLIYISLLCLYNTTGHTQIKEIVWENQISNTNASLRGVSAVNEKIAWTSGAKGTYLQTVDGGKTWNKDTVRGASLLDFRDIEAFDGNIAYLMACQPASIYKTINGGETWTLQYLNSNKDAFFDSFAFWDKKNGIAIGDPINGRFLIVYTKDGVNWKELPYEYSPAALDGEACFAASGTCLVTNGKSDVFFCTGGLASRVFKSSDRGKTWKCFSTPVLSGISSTGIFSIAFSDNLNGIIVGGDYAKEAEMIKNFAITKDGGQSWHLINKYQPNGFRSAVAYLPGDNGKCLITVGPLGCDYSNDGGKSWSISACEGFHSLCVVPDKAVGWAVGANGKISKFIFK